MHKNQKFFFSEVSYTKSRWDTCFNGTLAFPDYKRSEVGGEPAIKGSPLPAFVGYHVYLARLLKGYDNKA
jgi:hypothetical protein